MSAAPLPLLSAARARDLVARFAGRRLLVIGDVMLDRFLVGRVNRISPEAPVPVVVFDHDEVRLGGAANVAQNIAALGGTPALLGVVGADEDAAALRAALDQAGIAGDGLVTDASRRTTTKRRVVTVRRQLVARVDYEADHDIGDAVAAALAAAVDARAAAVQAVVVSDYLKGVVTRRLMAQTAAAALAHGLPLLVDPKVAHMDFYRGSTLVTPNHLEAETASSLRIRTADEAARAAALLRKRTGAEGILITLGEHGMWLSHGQAEGPLAAAAREVSDVTGAGDTVIATLALAFAAGATSTEAAHLANQAAGIVVGKFGAATVTGDELLSRFVR